MNTSYGLDAYRSHDLNIAMKTSSGDVIKLDFVNEQSASLRHSQNENRQKLLEKTLQRLITLTKNSIPNSL